MQTKSTSVQQEGTENIRQAQSEMCNAYANGALRIIVSGLAWLAAAGVSMQLSNRHAIWTLTNWGNVHPSIECACSEGTGAFR